MLENHIQNSKVNWQETTHMALQSFMFCIQSYSLFSLMMDWKLFLLTVDGAKVRGTARQLEDRKRIQDVLYELVTWNEKIDWKISTEVQWPESDQTTERTQDEKQMPLNGTTILDPETAENHKENVIQ